MGFPQYRIILQYVQLPKTMNTNLRSPNTQETPAVLLDANRAKVLASVQLYHKVSLEKNIEIEKHPSNSNREAGLNWNSVHFRTTMKIKYRWMHFVHWLVRYGIPGVSQHPNFNSSNQSTYIKGGDIITGLLL